MHKASILTANMVPELGLLIFKPGVSELHKFNGRMLIIPVPEQLTDKSVGPISLSSSFFSDELSDIEDIKQILKLHVDPEPPASFMKNPKPQRWVSPTYLQWVKSQPCCVCGAIADDAHHLIGHGLGGMGTKGHDFYVIPLCRVHHSELHQDPKKWESVYGTQLNFHFKFSSRAFALGVLG